MYVYILVYIHLYLYTVKTVCMSIGIESVDIDLDLSVHWRLLFTHAHVSCTASFCFPGQPEISEIQHGAQMFGAPMGFFKSCCAWLPCIFLTQNGAQWCWTIDAAGSDSTLSPARWDILFRGCHHYFEGRRAEHWFCKGIFYKRERI